MGKVYYDRDADLKLLKGKQIAVIGYGSQGHAQALNLRDSGLKVTVGLRPGGASYHLARKHGWEPKDIIAAVKVADWVQILLPDQVQAEVWQREIRPNLKKAVVVGFSHGFNIHYRQIIPPDFVDVVMVAPKAPGHLLRRMYEEKKGTPALFAVAHNVSGKARKLALAYARGIGATRAGVLETTFAEETETDLFGEQVVLCGGVVELIKKGFETLVEAGYQPEVAYFECLHELKLIVDLIQEGGIAGMNISISDTAEYGEYTRGPRIVTEECRQEMRRILGEIHSGVFAREWILENKVGRPVFLAARDHLRTHLIEKVGQRLRSMMPWLKKSPAQEK